MNSREEKYNPNPKQNANLLSKIFFTYTLPIFRKGHKKDIISTDLYNPLPEDRSKYLGDRLESKWNQHLKQCRNSNQNPSLLKVLMYTFWPEYVYIGVIIFVTDLVLKFLSPVMFEKLLDYFKIETEIDKYEAAWYAGSLVLITGIHLILVNQYVMGANNYGMRVRIACCSVIYRKALRLSKSSLCEISTGKIINFLSNDVNRFDSASVFLHCVWIGPLSAIMVTYFIYSKAGISGLAGVVFVLIMTPLQSHISRRSARSRSKVAQKTDERLKFMDEILAGVQVIKMYAWEKPFAKLIKLARRRELNIIVRASYLRGILLALRFFVGRAALYTTLLSMVLMDQPITASKVFVLAAYYKILTLSAMTKFVAAISHMTEIIVSVKRVEQFLLLDEYLVYTSTSSTKVNSNNTILKLLDVRAKWNTSSSVDAVENVSISLKNGELLVVIGSVGSGKTSLLETILGELVVSSGKKVVDGTVSYSSQEPWLFGETIKQNIIFNSMYDEKRYNEVIRVCDLDKDFQHFPNRDLTLAGDSGASLSGGQKARINLARAIFREADIYLLDDPLSAVDVHVAKHLYEHCIRGYLKNKTIILVTHQVHLLQNAERVIVLKNGNISNEGISTELDSSYTQSLNTADDQRPSGQEEKKLISANATTEVEVSEKLLQKTSNNNELKERNEKDLQEFASYEKAKGPLFFRYLYSSAKFYIVYLVIFSFILTEFVAGSTDYFLSFWVGLEDKKNTTILEDGQIESNQLADFPTKIYINIYGAMVAGLLLLASWRSLLFYKLAMYCSQAIHDNLFDKVIGTTMRFFDVTPSGRIMNRFTKDLGTVDEQLPRVIIDASQLILNVIGATILIAIVNPYMFIMVIVIVIFFMIIRNIFIKTSKKIKRLEGIMRSPVFTHLRASMTGLTTIRAFGAQEQLSHDFDVYQDQHTSAWFMYITANSAYGFLMDFICFMFVGTVIFSFLLYRSRDKIDGSEVGLAITQAMGISTAVQFGMRQSAEIANQLVSFERIAEYNNLEDEPEPKKPLCPPKDWPSSGKIVFKDMGFRYSEETPLILKNLNIVMNQREKVGIVGRTGAGKSSLFSAMFRLSLTEGNVEIDNIDTKDLLLETLRSKISIIPQNPVLFSGTLRYNLDPFEEYDDVTLYRALDEVELKNRSESTNRLECRVTDRGSNYSVGEKQLICLARAIIRNNKILMLDEATANVDPETDNLIQKAIREKFVDCTVLTVAHRLNTIMDSEKILVLDSGSVIEYDHPFLLLQNSEGIFYKMVMESGKPLSDQLQETARHSYEKLQMGT